MSDNNFQNLDLPISFGVKDNILHTRMNGQWVPLGASGSNTTINTSKNPNIYIPASKRDILLSKAEMDSQTAPYNVNYNYVSAFDRYIGWYKENTSTYMYSMVLPKKRFYSFSVGRIVNGKPIEEISKAEVANAISAKGDPVFWNMGLVFNEASKHYKYVKDDKEVIVNYDKISLKALDAITEYPILCTDFGNAHNHTSMLKETPDPITSDLVFIRIDWNTVPKDAYFRYSINTELGYLPSLDGVTVKTLVHHNNIGTPAFSDLSSHIVNHTILKKGNEYYTNEYHYLDKDGDPINDFIKIERPTERFTWIAFEVRNTTNYTGSNTRQGIYINMFIPEEDYTKTVRGYNETDFMYIKDLSKAGKIWNMLNFPLSDYATLPTYPRLGDRLTVISGIDAVGKNINPTQESYIYLGPIVANRGLNPGNAGYLYKSARYNTPYPKGGNVEILLNSNDHSMKDFGPNEYYKHWFKVTNS